MKPLEPGGGTADVSPVGARANTPAHLVRWAERPAEPGAGGVVRRRCAGAGAALVRVEIPAGTVAAAHSHPHEQFVEVIRGAGVLTTPAGRARFRAGDLFHFPPGTEHAAEFDEDTVLLEVNLPG